MSRSRLALPALALAALSSLFVGVLAAVRTESLSVGGGFLALAVGFSMLLWPSLQARRLSRAHRLWEAGDDVAAEALWQAVARAPLLSARLRSEAWLNLANVSLERGELPAAERAFAAVSAARLLGLARAGLALVATVDGRYELARERLVAASSGPSAQGEVDGVRALWVLRQEGSEAARALVDAIEGPEAGLLLTAVGALVRGEADPALAEAVRASPLRWIPDLAPILAAGRPHAAAELPPAQP